MSKQLKYKLKKTLKNAEFVHADLEYHQELSKDAILEFQEEVSRLVRDLPEEEQTRLAEQVAVTPQAPPQPAEEEPPQLIEESNESDCTDLVPTDSEPEDEDEEAVPKIKKEVELKKLFRRIAAETHPDKVRASGFSEKEILRLERIFMRAKEAYDNQNWYVLYSIAIDLDLSVDDPTDEQIEWIEEDIKRTLAAIAGIANLTAWHWYVGDDDAKNRALKFYFLQIYGFEYPGL